MTETFLLSEFTSSVGTNGLRADGPTHRWSGSARRCIAEWAKRTTAQGRRIFLRRAQHCSTALAMTGPPFSVS